MKFKTYTCSILLSASLLLNFSHAESPVIYPVNSDDFKGSIQSVNNKNYPIYIQDEGVVNFKVNIRHVDIAHKTTKPTLFLDVGVSSLDKNFMYKNNFKVTVALDKLDIDWARSHFSFKEKVIENAYPTNDSYLKKTMNKTIIAEAVMPFVSESISDLFYVISQDEISKMSSQASYILENRSGQLSIVLQELKKPVF